MAEKVRNKERAAKGAPKGNKDKSVMPATGAAVKNSSARTAGAVNKGASGKTANKSAAGKNSQGKTADKKALKSAPVNGARENAQKAAEKQLPAQVVSREARCQKAR